MGAEGANEDVSGEERFEVYEGEGVGGCEEDLVRNFEWPKVNGLLGFVERHLERFGGTHSGR